MLKFISPRVLRRLGVKNLVIVDRPTIRLNGKYLLFAKGLYYLSLEDLKKAEWFQNVLLGDEVLIIYYNKSLFKSSFPPKIFKVDRFCVRVFCKNHSNKRRSHIWRKRVQKM